MTHYLNLTLLSDEEVPLYFLRNKTYTKLHKALCDLNATDIGISFPQADKRLGCVIRIHSTKNRLDELQTKNWLGGLSGYCKISEISPVPDKIKGYQTFSRIRQTMTDAKLKQRIKYQKSQGVLSTDEEVKEYARQYKAAMFKTGLDNPYLELQSISTGNHYRLYIAFGELQTKPVSGKFNRFGLSSIATIPLF